ncbi:MAG TPA: serine/threonine-protein kinase [Planctomycetota bacterium]|nr:serine/threonine-protein kinase [Planctomycetota bacterium]
MPYVTDGLVGKLALQKGMISAGQLKDCLAEQAALQKSGQKRPLGVIMVGKGLMKDEDLLVLLEEQKRVLAERSNFTQIRKDDFLFGQILLKQGVATSAEINDALRLQAEAAERGEMSVPRLGQILIEMGVAQEKEIQRTLKLQYKTLYECPGCTLKYNLVDASGDKQYRCKKCDAILVPKPPGSGIRADESAYGLALEVASDLPPEVAQAELDPSNTFGKYILVRPLGRGGSGVVHLAYQKELKRFVALKLLRGTDDAESAQRFADEAQLAARLRHPNIVSVYEIGKHHNVSYIALEYVEGSSLDQRGKLPIRRSTQIIRDVAAAIHAAHEWGVIHRDLKPQNILLDVKDRPVVTDFGLAREVSAARDVTEHGIVVGTPAYMSVEQATGERALDGRSDVASLGAVFYELLTGRQPYQGRTPVDIALAVIHQTPTRPRDLNPDLPAALEAICMKAMAKRREERYLTARAFAEDLQRFLEGEAVQAGPQGKLSATVRRLARNKTSSILAAAALATIAIAATVVAAVHRESQTTARLLEARTLESDGRLWDALRLYEQVPAARGEAERLRETLRARDAEARERQDRDRAAAILSEIGGDPTPADRITIATRALDIWPAFEQAYVIRALARQDLGEDASAYDDLGRAIQVSRNPLAHHLSRAEIARRLGRVEDEITDLSAALEQNPFSTDLRIHRAWASAKLARKLADTAGPQARTRAELALHQAESDLATVKRHSLLEPVREAVKEAHAALHRGS